MTHATETGAINRLHFSGAHFWHVCHANLGPDSSGSLPDSGADYNTILFQARKWHACDWNDHLWFIPFQLTFGWLQYTL